jgi:hypothetical protein
LWKRFEWNEGRDLEYVFVAASSLKVKEQHVGLQGFVYPDA